VGAFVRCDIETALRRHSDVNLVARAGSAFHPIEDVSLATFVSFAHEVQVTCLISLSRVCANSADIDGTDGTIARSSPLRMKERTMSQMTYGREGPAIGALWA
jgi:hypothetical protein